MASSAELVEQLRLQWQPPNKPDPALAVLAPRSFYIPTGGQLYVCYTLTSLPVSLNSRRGAACFYACRKGAPGLTMAMSFPQSS